MNSIGLPCPARPALQPAPLGASDQTVAPTIEDGTKARAENATLGKYVSFLFSMG